MVWYPDKIIRSYPVSYNFAMLYAVVFLVLAVQLFVLAVAVGGWAWLLAWPAISFATVALGYLGVGPRVFGKRLDGTRHPLATFVLLPYLAFTYFVWWIACRLSREPTRHEIVTGLHIGRRLAHHELPADTALVVDLTCEFIDGSLIRQLPGYVCVPTLDAMPPSAERFREAVQRATACSGVVFVHCAQGHGRSGLFVAAVLLARGLVSTPAEAVRRVRAVRPGVRLKPSQRRFLEMLARG